MLRVAELFGGIGAFRKALINLKIEHEVAEYVEIDKNCVKSYNRLYNESFSPKSVTECSLKECGNIDILMHGSPCQDFSRIGEKNGGKKGSGTRSSLLFETIRIIEEMDQRPRAVIWENVKGALDKKMRASFFYYIDEMRRLGYTTEYRILNAMDFGIPQKRERIYAVSILGDRKFDFDRLEKKKACHISRYLENTEDDKYIVKQPSMLKHLKGINNNHPFEGRLQVIESFCYTITTKQVRIPNAGLISLGNGKYRYLTERECFRLMGYSDEDFSMLRGIYPEKKGKKSSILYKQAGNSIVVNVLVSILKELIKMQEV